jgi:hypothetical protein
MAAQTEKFTTRNKITSSISKLSKLKEKIED